MANTKHDEEKWKIEEYALGILRQCDIFEGVNLIHAEKPDIQAKDKSWGVEVVSAVDPEVAAGQKQFNRIVAATKTEVLNRTKFFGEGVIASGAGITVKRALEMKVPSSTRNIRFECSIQEGKNKKNTIENGGKIVIPDGKKDYCISMMVAPTSHANTDPFYRVVSQKLEKLQNGNYDGFEKKGLFVFTAIPEIAKEEFVLPFLKVKNTSVMFDYIFFYNMPFQTLNNETASGNLWFVKKSEIL